MFSNIFYEAIDNKIIHLEERLWVDEIIKISFKKYSTTCVAVITCEFFLRFTSKSKPFTLCVYLLSNNKLIPMNIE